MTNPKLKGIREYGIKIGTLPTGPSNRISDASGVKVGHVTLSQGSIYTVVTAILPHCGDIVIAFSTANKVPHNPSEAISQRSAFHDLYLDPVFRAAGEAVEESILNSMVLARTTVGRDGHQRKSLQDYLPTYVSKFRYSSLF